MRRELEIRELKQLVKLEEDRSHRGESITRRDVGEALLRLARSYAWADRQDDVVKTLRRAAGVYSGVAISSAAQAYLWVVETCLELGMLRAARRAALDARRHADALPSSEWQMRAMLYEYLADQLRRTAPAEAWTLYTVTAEMWRSDDVVHREHDCLAELVSLAERRHAARAIAPPNGYLRLEIPEGRREDLRFGAVSLDCAFLYRRLGRDDLADHRLVRLLQTATDPGVICAAGVQLAVVRLGNDPTDRAHWRLLERALETAGAATDIRHLHASAINEAAEVASQILREETIALPLRRRLVRLHQQHDESLRGTVEAYLAVAEWLSRGHEFDEALEALSRADELSRERDSIDGPVPYVRVLIARAKIAMRYRDIEMTKMALTQADRAARRIGVRHLHGRCWRSRVECEIGHMHALLGDVSKARERWNRSIAFSSAHADHHANRLAEVASAYARIHEFAAGAQHMLRAAVKRREVGQEIAASSHELAAAGMLTQAGDIDEAERLFHDVKVAAERHGVAWLRAEVAQYQAHQLIWTNRGSLGATARDECRELLLEAAAHAREARSESLLASSVAHASALGEPSEGGVLIQQTLSELPATTSAASRLRLHESLAECELAAGDVVAATATLERARALSEETSCEGCRICVCNVQRVSSRLADLDGDPAGALATSQACLDLARRQAAGDHPEARAALIHALLDVSVRDRATSANRADALLVEAQDLAQDARLPGWVSPSVLLIAAGAARDHDLERSIALYREALVLLERRNDTNMTLRVRASRGLADALVAYGDEGAAEQELATALHLALQRGSADVYSNIDTVYALMTMSSLARHRGDLDDADDALRQAELLTTPTSAIAVTILLQRANALLARGMAADAEVAFRDVHTRALRLNWWVTAASAQIGRISAGRSIGDMSSATQREFAQEAIELYTRERDLVGIGNARANLGVALSEEGRRSEALREFDRAVDLHRQTNWSSALVWSLRRRADLSRDSGDDEAALADLDEAVAVATKARREKGGPVVMDIEQRRAALLARTDPLRAFTGWEEARGQRLRHELARDLSPLSPQVRSELHDLRSQLDELVEKTDATAISRRIALRLQLQQIQASRSSADGGISAAPLDLDALHDELLDDHTALLSYVASNTHALVFCVTADGIEAREIDGSALHLGQQIAELMWAARQTDLTGRYPHGHDLYRKLIGPVAERIGDRDLVIVPDGPLNLLPFQLLLTQHPDEAELCSGAPLAVPMARSLEGHSGWHSALLGAQQLGHWTIDEPLVAAEMRRRGPFASSPAMLLRRHVVSFAPSAAAALALHRRRQTRRTHASRTLAAFSHPVRDRPDQRNDPTAEEVRGISALVSSRVPDRPLVCEAGDATVDAFRSITHRRAPRFRFVHVAAHAEFHVDDPELSGIRFAEDGGSDRWLRLVEIATSPLRCEVVTLSCCATAGGRIVAGEGISGLTRSFLQAGAGAVCGTLWPVPDETTPDLMQTFYRHLLDGEAPAVALRAAQLAMITRGGVHALPIVWGGFVVTGGA